MDTEVRKKAINSHDQSDLVDELLADSPGALRGEIKLTLNTRQAQRLFLGRPVKKRNGEQVHPGVIGVRRFATIVRHVVLCARADDPYADQCLIELDRQFRATQEALEQLRQEVLERLQARPAVAITVAHSIDPVTITLYFQNQYAYRAAYLVADYDLLAAAALSAHHSALMQRTEVEHVINRGRRLVRRVWSIPVRFHFSGASRQDILQMTARGTSALEKYGPVPDDILNRALIPDYGAVRLSDGEPIVDTTISDEELEAAAAV